MRRAIKNVAVVNENGNILLSFGFDFCAEHEWGIKGIRRSFGISGDENDLTLGRLAVTKADESNLRLFEAKNRQKEPRLYLLGGMQSFYGQTPAQFAVGNSEAYDRDGEPTSLWDERAFMFSLPIGHKRERNMRSIHKAILDKDALIYLAGIGNPFGGSGLVIVRRSTIPVALVESMEEGFRDQKRLKEASEATGIRERVEAWGRSKGGFCGAFYALSPKWMFKDRKASSKHPVIYWLNPSDQQNNNFGWFTVEELEQWMDGKGPIPKRRSPSPPSRQEGRI